MKKLLTMVAILLSSAVYAQHTFKAIISDDKTKLPLTGASATIATLKTGATADTAGLVSISNIPAGKIEVVFSFVGYIPQVQTLLFPLKNNAPLAVYLEPLASELAEVTVQTTRTNQNLKDIPTRIEALPQDELDEKGTMRPGDIKMLLGESTGILVQQTSAVSSTANFRIQGLDSRYTQLLKDGIPLYEGFSGGLSLMQVSPLDLRQVEFIKGSASTLYGGGAIAGLVNLISKTPQSKPELTFLLNGNTAKGDDASGFYAQKWKHIGTTIFGSYNYNGAFAPGDAIFTAVPATKRYTLNPKVFLYLNDQDSGWIGLNGTYEKRFGGDINVVEGKPDNLHQYFEKNDSYRFSSQLSFNHRIDSAAQLNFKNTIGYFNRNLLQPGFGLNAKQTSSYSEINYINHHKKLNWVIGANFLADHLTVPAPLGYLNNDLNNLGGFVQNTYKASNWFSLETGLRVDYNQPAAANKASGIFVLPRINGLFKLNEHFTSRLGGGLGYKMPTVFNDQTEQQGYQDIIPVIAGSLKAEQSYGANADLNYRGAIGDAFVNFNELFFYTRVDDPLLLTNNIYANAQGYINTRGAETNLKVFMDDLGIYFGYTYTDTRQHVNGLTSPELLTPKSRISADVTYEIENSLRAGIEGYYTSKQLLSDGTTGRGFYTFGLLVQKMWKQFDVFINCENLSDQRQTRWASIYSGTITDPVFKDIYAPLDGVVVNVGLRVKVK